MAIDYTGYTLLAKLLVKYICYTCIWRNKLYRELIGNTNSGFTLHLYSGNG